VKQHMNRSRSHLAAALLTGALLISGSSGRLLAHDAPGEHADPVAVIKASQEMAQSAQNLWAALTPEQQKQVGFEFESPERQNWHFVPIERKGLPWKQMTPAQQALGHAMLISGLSQRGYAKAETIMSLEQVLNDMEKGRGQFKRDPENYFFSVFGKPGSTDPKQPWGWRVEGHHLSLNFTIVGGKGVAAGPIFMGTNPAEVREGPRKGLRVLGAEEDLGRAFVKSLNEEQRKKAIIAAEAPKDIISFDAHKAKPLDPLGITVNDLTDDQKQKLATLVLEYAQRLRPELSEEQIERIHKAGVDKVSFAWAGGTEKGDLHYYRVQGPTFLIEFDDTQNGGNHIHSVWRDLENDFGEDLLKEHYEKEHNK
jgi:Protein of unknown function (DUF3500)